MPIVFYKPLSADTSICVWKIDETEEELLQGIHLSEDDEINIKGQKLPRRRTEKAACRKALAFLLDNDRIAIEYDSEGAPHIQGCNISFSHSSGYVAVAASKSERVGVDIEPVSDRIVRLAHKFMNEAECAGKDLTDNKMLHFYWGSKEAIIKLNGQKEIDFHQNITITPENESCERGTLTTPTGDRTISITSWFIRGCALILAQFQK